MADLIKTINVDGVKKQIDYEALANLPTIPDAVTESTVSDWGFTKNTGTYIKSTNGIPYSDLEKDVQNSLDLANSALQSYTEVYQGTVKKVNNTEPDENGNVTISIPDAVTETTVSNWGFTKNTGTYIKPTNGIPKTDLDVSVQNSLSLADSALQSYTEVYQGTVKKVNNTEPDENGNVTISIPDTVTESTVSGWGFTKNTGTYIKPTNGIPKTDLDASVQETLNNVATLIGDDTNKSARSISAEEVAKIVAAAPEDFDTLKEIADWIQSDTTGAAKMQTDISTLNKASHTHSNMDILNGLTDASISGKQDISNLVTSLSSASTDTQYPSAKCVYDIIGDIESALNKING